MTRTDRLPTTPVERPYRVTVVCTGNICRSPMGEFVLRERFAEAGLGDRVVVDSAGTHSWEVGNPADPRTLAVLARNGHDDFGGRDHVARRFERSWFDDVDLVLEFFTVLHRATPARLRAGAALREVHLLIEVLADRAARRAVGPVPLARALVALAAGSHPETALGATEDRATTAARMRLVAEPDASSWLRLSMVAFAIGVLAAPVALLVVAVG